MFLGPRFWKRFVTVLEGFWEAKILQNPLKSIEHVISKIILNFLRKMRPGEILPSATEWRGSPYTVGWVVPMAWAQGVVAKLISTIFFLRSFFALPNDFEFNLQNNIEKKGSNIDCCVHFGLQNLRKIFQKAMQNEACFATLCNLPATQRKLTGTIVCRASIRPSI